MGVSIIAGIVTALVVALILTKVLGLGLGLMPMMVIVGLGIMGYGIADKFLTKGNDDAR
jgi:hypothetical protein